LRRLAAGSAHGDPGVNLKPQPSEAMNPLRQARHREVAILASGAAAFAIASAWALRPLAAAQHDLPDHTAQQEAPTKDDSAPALNLAAFLALIWNPRPHPVQPVAVA